MRILYVVGTRPNFVKTAPVIAAMRSRLPDGRHVIVHTGQHYDRAMSEVFFEELGVPAPDHMLEVGSGTHAQQTARTMERLEPVIEDEKPDLLVVPGDVNSTLAAVLTAVKMGIPVAHVESGLRSFDLSMPEEVNRIVADRFGSHLFLHSEEAIGNLRAEGIAHGTDALRRQHDDRHAGRARGPDRGGGDGGEARPLPRLLPAGHPAPPGAGRRAAARRDGRPARPPGAARCRSSSRSTRGPAR